MRKSTAVSHLRLCAVNNKGVEGRLDACHVQDGPGHSDSFFFLSSHGDRGRPFGILIAVLL